MSNELLSGFNLLWSKLCLLFYCNREKPLLDVENVARTVNGNLSLWVEAHNETVWSAERETILLSSVIKENKSITFF